MGFVRKNLGIDITGGGARRAAERASRGSVRAGQEAQQLLAGATQPFSQLGIEAGGQLLGALPQQADPSQIINNPFFQALSQDLQQGTLANRAALGLAGSGGTQDALARQQLLLGNQFQQQDLANQQSRFSNLFGITQFGADIGLQSAVGQGDLITGTQNARNVGIQAQAQQQAALGSQALQLGGAAFGALGGLSGIGGLLGIGGGAGAGQIGAAAAGVGSGASGLSGFSDKRLKRDIRKVGKDESGNIYQFRYIDSDTLYKGRIADELQKIRPDAVSVHKSGYLQVSDEFKSKVA